jgi:nesprin-1
LADEEEKEIIEQEVVMLQEEFDIHNDTLQKTKALLEVN